LVLFIYISNIPKYTNSLWLLQVFLQKKKIKVIAILFGEAKYPSYIMA